jgi:hypothetical protein
MSSPPPPPPARLTRVTTTRSKECISLTIDIGIQGPGIRLYFWEPKPVSTPEIQRALLEIEALLLRLPLTSTHCDIPVGDNVAEINWTIEQPVPGPVLKEMMADVETYFSKFRHKPDKVDIYDEITE